MTCCPSPPLSSWGGSRHRTLSCQGRPCGAPYCFSRIFSRIEHSVSLASSIRLLLPSAPKQREPQAHPAPLDCTHVQSLCLLRVRGQDRRRLPGRLLPFPTPTSAPCMGRAGPGLAGVAPRCGPTHRAALNLPPSGPPSPRPRFGRVRYTHSTPGARHGAERSPTDTHARELAEVSIAAITRAAARASGTPPGAGSPPSTEATKRLASTTFRSS